MATLRRSPGMSRSRGIGPRAGGAARRGAWGVARIVSLITSVVVGLIVIGIVLVLLEANRDNAIVDWLVGAGKFLAQPFDNVFQLDGRKARVAVNWGLAALIYAFAGSLIARLLRR
jgi:hypothetical protein